MAIVLNHTIVRSRDKEASAQFFADIFGLKVEPGVGHFAAVRVNDTLTLDFADWEVLESHHYAFHVIPVLCEDAPNYVKLLSGCIWCFCYESSISNRDFRKPRRTGESTQICDKR